MTIIGTDATPVSKQNAYHILDNYWWRDMYCNTELYQNSQGMFMLIHSFQYKTILFLMFAALLNASPLSKMQSASSRHLKRTMHKSTHANCWALTSGPHRAYKTLPIDKDDVRTYGHTLNNRHSTSSWAMASTTHPQLMLTFHATPLTISCKQERWRLRRAARAGQG